MQQMEHKFEKTVTNMPIEDFLIANICRVIYIDEALRTCSI